MNKNENTSQKFIVEVGFGPISRSLRRVLSQTDRSIDLILSAKVRISFDDVTVKTDLSNQNQTKVRSKNPKKLDIETRCSGSVDFNVKPLSGRTTIARALEHIINTQCQSSCVQTSDDEIKDRCHQHNISEYIDYLTDNRDYITEGNMKRMREICWPETYKDPNNNAMDDFPHSHDTIYNELKLMLKPVINGVPSDYIIEKMRNPEDLVYYVNHVLNHDGFLYPEESSYQSMKRVFGDKMPLSKSAWNKATQEARNNAITRQTKPKDKGKDNPESI